MNITTINHRRYGFSLVEVLVAAAVFSLGLGGLSLMMLTSAHGSVEAQNKTAAAMQAASLAELILLNPAATDYYIHPDTKSGGDCFAAGACSASAWARNNLARWRHELQQNLANATGVVCFDATPQDGGAADPACDGEGGAVVKVFWVESRHLHDSGGGLRRVVLPVAK